MQGELFEEILRDGEKRRKAKLKQIKRNINIKQKREKRRELFLRRKDMDLARIGDIHFLMKRPVKAMSSALELIQI